MARSPVVVCLILLEGRILLARSNVNRHANVCPVISVVHAEISRQELLRRFSNTTSPPKVKRRVSFTNREIKDVLALHGLLPDDIRIREVMQAFDSGDGTVTMEDFEHIREHSVLINRALSGNLVIPDFEEMRDDIQELYDSVKHITSGKNADYIPQLSEKNVNPDQFGVSICSIDGQRFNVGDTEARFGVQSCCKAISYCIAQTLHGVEKTHEHVGMEPSGRPFNEMCLDERAHNADLERKKRMSADAAKNFKVSPKIPHNPMINAGAIMVTSLLYRDQTLADRFDSIMKVRVDVN